MSLPHLREKERLELQAHEKAHRLILRRLGVGEKCPLPHFARELSEARGLLIELCRGHNTRGSDGPCDCSACRHLREKGLT